MSLGKIHRIQDSIHGLMEFRGMEAVVVHLLKTPELQRLRRIRQLGLAHFVFPAAEHSRLAHSLGASYIAVRFGRQLSEDLRNHYIPLLCPDDESIRDIAVAALCHDLGHGPLSHAWEREIVGHDFDRDAWARSLGLDNDDPSLAKLKWHELVTHGLLNWAEGGLHLLLEEQEAGSTRRIRDLLVGNYYLPYLSSLLSGDVDVDRADFIARDTHHTGVAYGRYDLDWLISTCTVGEETHRGRKHLVLGFDARKSIRVIEQFLIARRALYETVYHHKTVRCFEGMVGLFLKRLKLVLGHERNLSGLSHEGPLMRMIAGETLEPSEILRLDDFSLWVLIDDIARLSPCDSTLSNLARRIISRDLFKMVPVDSDHVRDFFLDPESHARLAETVSRSSPELAAGFNYFTDRVKFQMFAEESESYVVEQHRRASPAKEHPELKKYVEQTPERVRLFTVQQAVEPVARLISGISS